MRGLPQHQGRGPPANFNSIHTSMMWQQARTCGTKDGYNAVCFVWLGRFPASALVVQLMWPH
jgi:hypothetical protein